MSQPAWMTYLTEVLGMKWLPQVKAQEERKLSIFVPRDLSSIERDLLRKMMAAIKLDNYEVVVGLRQNPGLGLAFGLGTPGLVVEESGQRLMHSFDLINLLEGPESDVFHYKRQAWEHLKAVQIWLKEK